MATLTRLEIEDLELTRGDRRLFGDLSFSAGSGQAVALGGPNGAGKTSLLRAIAGLLRPTSGRIEFGGNAGTIDEREAIRSQAHFIGHSEGFAGSLTAQDELLFSADWSGGSREAALAAVDTLGMARLLHLPTRKLSAGQKRRLALIRLLAAPRPLWLLDEPASPLDAAARVWLGQVMADHLSSGGLIVVAAHDPLPVAALHVSVGA